MPCKRFTIKSPADFYALSGKNSGTICALKGRMKKRNLSILISSVRVALIIAFEEPNYSFRFSVENP